VEHFGAKWGLKTGYVLIYFVKKANKNLFNCRALWVLSDFEVTKQIFPHPMVGAYSITISPVQSSFPGVCTRTSLVPGLNLAISLPGIIIHAMIVS